MISILDLAKELEIKQEELINKAVSLKIKLRARGKSLTDEDADRIRESYAPAEEEEKEQKGNLPLPWMINVKDLSERMEASVAEVLKILMQNGVLANINDDLDFDTAAIIADEMGFVAVEEEVRDDEQLDQVVETDHRLKTLLSEEDPKKQKPRPPIVTVMGHVDHGKTSLLDAIRETNVFEGEVGGITQHIGAYQVEKDGRKITFLDTPGHEAFTAMRARGAQVTDVVILVVAADDGVQPQTIEAINHAQAAGVPIVVAVNKIDKPGADIERVKRELSEKELAPEDWGGKTTFVSVSAKKKQGIEDLLEMVLLTADLLELKANPDREAIGTIVEAKKTQHKGVVSTVLIQAGTLEIGQPVLVGSVAGRIKDMVSDKGKKLKKVEPAMPAEISGLAEVPEAGDILQVVESERVAQQLSALLKRKERATRLRPASKISLESFYEQSKSAKVKELNLILKADVQGSLEAIKDSLRKLETKEVKVKIIHEGTGDINPSDLTLAAASDAVVIGFHVKKGTAALQTLQQVDVDVKIYTIIYQLIDDIRKAMGGLLSPEDIEILRGKLEVKAVFSGKRDRWTVGGYLAQGVLKQGDNIRIRRKEDILDEAQIVSLRRENTEVKEVKDGVECGVLLKKVKTEIKKGDFLEVYITEKRKREL